MSLIKLEDKHFKRYITDQEIATQVKRMAYEVARDLDQDTNPLFIGILNGSFMFVADFIREYPNQCELSFVKMASYEGTSSTGQTKQLIGLNQDLKGRTVIILEDIIDTGNTLQEIYRIFENTGIKELRIATLFFKPEVYKKELAIDYIGISIPDKFIVGYGLDYNEIGRNLSDVYQLTEAPKMKNIVLFGPPGAGKGTQADVLKEKYNLEHISTGDVFRFNIKNETELGLLAKSYMDHGNLVPDEVTINMLQAEVEKHPEANGFIFDGFPRTQDQAAALDAFLLEKGEGINGMLALEVDEDLLVARLLERGKVSGRADDQDESKIRNRFQEYRTKTEIVKEYYAKQNSFYAVDGVGSIDEVTSRLTSVIDKL
ncbi:MAG: adenylate kinase [Flavobacteriaceae bacterium]